MGGCKAYAGSMMLKLVIHRKAQKSLERLPKKHKQHVLAAIDLLLANPYLGKKLEGDYLGSYTLRVWPYRIIYTFEKKQLTIYVLDIGHRQGVYK
jgi:mRNA interferase RelE/StbE